MGYTDYLKFIYQSEPALVSAFSITILILGYLVVKDFFSSEEIGIKPVTVQQMGTKINQDFAVQSWDEWEPNPPILRERFDWEALIILAIEALIIAVTFLGFTNL